MIRIEAKERAEAFSIDETDDIVFVHKQKETVKLLKIFRRTFKKERKVYQTKLSLFWSR